MELVIGFVGSLVGAVAALGGAWLNKIGERDIQREERIERQKIEDDRKKKDLTREIFLKWEEIENLQARIKAEQIILADNGDYDAMASSNKLDEWLNVSRIFHFVEMLGDLLKDEQLDLPLYRSLFRRDISYWAPLLVGKLSKEKSPGRVAAIQKAMDAFTE
jgi:hypothetical protein